MSGSANLSQIAGALFAALQGLAPVQQRGDGTTVYVGKYTGEVTAQHGVDTETLAAPVAALLAFEGEKLDKRETVVTILKSTSMVVGTSYWRVYCVVQRVGDASSELLGDGVDVGVLDLVDRVESALCGLEIDGLFEQTTVDLEECRPHLLRPGQACVYLCRFSAQRVVTQAARPSASAGVPFNGLESAGLVETTVTDAALIPLEQISVTTT